MSNRPIIIDSQAVGYRSFHAMGDLRFEDQAVGIIFGFLAQIQMYAKRFKTNRFYFCWDSRKNLRKVRYSWYKNRRKEKYTGDDEDKIAQQELESQSYKDAYLQFNMLRTHVLPSIGFKNQFIQTGVESDDLIAWIVKNIPDEYTVVTSDEDLYQLLDYCDIYSLGKKEIYNRASFVEEFGITPDKWVDVKQISGCKSDTVPGIIGVGEKTAIKYLTGTIPNGVKRSAIVSEEGKAIILRNRWLVELPIPETAPVKFVEDAFDIDGYFNICQEYNLRSFLEPKNLSFWRDQFDM